MAEKYFFILFKIFEAKQNYFHINKIRELFIFVFDKRIGTKTYMVLNGGLYEWT